MARGTDEDWDTLYEQARAALDSRDANRLDRCAAELIGCDPERSEGYRLRAEAARLRGDLVEAVRFASESVARDPEDSFCHYRLASFLRRTGDKVRAEKHLYEAIQRDPTHYAYWVERGWLAVDAKDTKLAERCADKARELAPYSTLPLWLRASIMPTERPAERRAAIEAFEQILERDPDDDQAWAMLADLHLANKGSAKAEDAIRTALSIDPTDGSHRALLFRVLKQRSWVYRVLRWPGDITWKGIEWIGRWPLWVLIPLGALALRFVVVFAFVGVAWAVLILPVLLLYQWLATASLGKRAREIVRPRRGFFDVIHWPPAARAALVVAAACVYWVGSWLALGRPTARQLAEAGGYAIGGLLVVLFVVGVPWMIVDWFRTRIRKRKARTNRLDPLLAPRDNNAVRGRGGAS